MSERDAKEPTFVISVTLGEAQFAAIGIAVGAVVAANVSSYAQFLIGFWAVVGAILISFIRFLLWVGNRSNERARMTRTPHDLT